MPSRCCHRSCVVRLPTLELLATPTSLPGPKSKELGRRIERPSASRRRPEDRSPKASAGRSRGSREDATSASGRTPVNHHTRRQLKEITPSATATRRERTSAAEDLRLGTEVPRQRPPTLEARSHKAHASALRVNHQADPVTTDMPSPQLVDPMSPPEPRALVPTHQRLPSMSPWTTPKPARIDALRSAPREVKRSSSGRSRRPRTATPRRRTRAHTTRKRRTPQRVIEPNPYPGSTLRTILPTSPPTGPPTPNALHRSSRTTKPPGAIDRAGANPSSAEANPDRNPSSLRDQSHRSDRHSTTDALMRCCHRAATQRR